MLEILERSLRQLEIKRERLLDSIGHISEEQLRRKPDPQSWSILEVVEHLVLAEQLAPHPSYNGPVPRSGRKSFELVSYVLNNDVIVGVPDSRMEPGGGATYAALCRTWSAARKRLEQALEDVTEDTLNRPLTHHAVAGALTPVDLLRLIDMHVDHHQRQIDRIREELQLGEGGSPFRVPRSPLTVQGSG